MNTRNHLNQMTVKGLRAQARSLGLSGYSKLRKPELVAALLSNPGSPADSSPASPASEAPRPTTAAALDLGPGALKYQSSAPQPHPEEADPALENLELPKAYGSGRIFLISRDPQRLYCYWDFSDHQLAKAQSLSRDSVHRLRLMEDDGPGRIVEEIALPPGAQSWYFPVRHHGATFHVCLGYLDAQGRYVELAASPQIRTLPVAPRGPGAHVDESGDETFVSISTHMPFRVLRNSPTSTDEADSEPRSELASRSATATAPPASPRQESTKTRASLAAAAAVSSPASNGHPGKAPASEAAPERPPLKLETLATPLIPALPQAPPATSPNSESDPEPGAGHDKPALPGQLPMDHAAGVRSDCGSHSLVQRARSLDWGVAASESAPSSPANWVAAPSSPESWVDAPTSPESWVEAPSSPGGAPWSSDHWMRVNAEVMVFGDTEPGSTVLANGQEIPTTPDGRFAFHWQLPDGDFGIELESTSANGLHHRAARVEFGRRTERRGDVGDHPTECDDLPPRA